MAKSIRNKTAGAVKVPLPQGKALHLGPNQIGHISQHDLDHPPLKKLLEEGTVEVYDEQENEAVPDHGRRGEEPFDS